MTDNEIKELLKCQLQALQDLEDTMADLLSFSGVVLRCFEEREHELPGETKTLAMAVWALTRKLSRGYDC